VQNQVGKREIRAMGASLQTQVEKRETRARVVTTMDGQTCPSVRLSVRHVRLSVCHVRPSCPFPTSDKALVRQIRINARLNFDRVKPELFCPR
jgi:hypothetical protein